MFELNVSKDMKKLKITMVIGELQLSSTINGQILKISIEQR